jgi:3-hydroxyanthranilate 3,4-dioxygenase
MSRKRMLHTFKEAADRGPYDEYPVLTPEVDPQLHLSKNDRPQPYFLVCEKDSMLVQMSGKGRIEFRGGPVLWLPMVPGDFIYVPARTPHRYMPDEVSVQYRYKARLAGREAVCWYCETCGTRLAVDTWDTAAELPQEAYLRATRAFNDSAEQRRCANCGTEHSPIDLSPYRWEAVARELREDELDEL